VQNYVPQIGDSLAVKRGVYEHICVYVGPRFLDGRDVIHNDKGDVVKFTTLAAFSKGSPIHLRKAGPSDYFQRQAVLQRAHELVGTKYNLLNFNCEHAATYIQTGRAESPQLQGAFVVGLALFVLALLAKQA
jgi:hypothetical protein